MNNSLQIKQTGKKWNIFQLITSLFFLLALISCATSSTEVSGDQLNSLIFEDHKHSARSWWLTNEDHEYYYLMERKGIFKKDYYKISKKQVVIDVGSASIYPVNIKTWHIKYLDDQTRSGE